MSIMVYRYSQITHIRCKVFHFCKKGHLKHGVQVQAVSQPRALFFFKKNRNAGAYNTSLRLMNRLQHNPIKMCIT